ncbi:hypothetical protein GCM10010182_11630 [Actinomadura cremea]|nr:hypothetical protein GCM10010182_11630 [Actinomadura cremea]
MRPPAGAAGRASALTTPGEEASPRTGSRDPERAGATLALRGESDDIEDWRQTEYVLVRDAFMDDLHPGRGPVSGGKIAVTDDVGDNVPELGEETL